MCPNQSSSVDRATYKAPTRQTPADNNGDLWTKYENNYLQALEHEQK